MVSLPKSPLTPVSLLSSYANMSKSAHPLKYLSETFYDIYLLHDQDIQVIEQVLQAYQEVKQKKNAILDKVIVAIKCGDRECKDANLTLVDFESSMVIRGRLVQMEATVGIDQYSYEAGNIGSLRVMFARKQDQEEDKQSFEGDEADSGGRAPEESSSREHSSAEKQHAPFGKCLSCQLMVGLHIVREVFSREPKAINIALENLAKISGCSVQAKVSLSTKNESVIKAIRQAQEEAKSGALVKIEVEEQDRAIDNMKKIVRFIEMFQQQFYD